jgi:hypothetical protein
MMVGELFLNTKNENLQDRGMIYGKKTGLYEATMHCG